MDPSAQVTLNKHLFTLPDKRILSYSLYGAPLSPSVPVIIFHHGFPSSSGEGRLWSPESIKQHIATSSLKPYTLPLYTVIAPERPGCGFSTPHPTRTVLSFADDILCLINALKINEFRVLAYSGGSPYGFALREKVPSTRLKKLTVVSGVYPLSLGTSDMLLPLRAVAAFGAWAPTWLTTQVLGLGIGAAALNPDQDVLLKMISKEMEDRPGKDKKCFENQDFKDMLVDSCRDAFRAGSAGQAVELGLLADWGFELDENTEEEEGKIVVINGPDGIVGEKTKVRMWHGGADVNTPIGMAEKAAYRLGDLCEYTRLQGETHTSLSFNHTQRILEDLLKD